MNNIITGWKKRSNKASLDVKLKLLMFAIMIPLVALIVFLFFVMIQYNQQYNSIVQNVTAASEFNFDFKDTIDSKMYQYIIRGGNGFEDYHTADDINGAASVVTRLKQTTTRSDSYKSLLQIEQRIAKLEGYIYSIRDVMSDPSGERYDKVMFMLETDVKIATEMIQETVQQYIYSETRELAEVRDRTTNQIEDAIALIAVGSVCLLIALWVVGIRIAKSITKPIKELCENTKAVAKGDFTPRQLEGIHGGEIQTLNDSFSTMVEKIGSLVDDVKLEQINLRKTELKLLQAQINPHFLYNTLDTIIWLAEDKQNQAVVDIVTSLSTFFRTTLSKGRDFITLKEEESHITSYLQIQQYRYSDILDYEIDIDPKASEYSILKLTLQPVIENALYHGIKNKRGKGKITIRGTIEYGNIVFTVTDNGIGMKEEELNSLRTLVDGLDGTRKGFGLTNVNLRIKLNYGKEYGLHIDSQYQVGTMVTIIIPMQRL